MAPWYNNGIWDGGVIPLQELKFIIEQLRYAVNERRYAIGRGTTSFPALGVVGRRDVNTPSTVWSNIYALREQVWALCTYSTGDTRRYVHPDTAEPWTPEALIADTGFGSTWLDFQRPQTCANALHQLRACLERLRWIGIDVRSAGWAVTYDPQQCTRLMWRGYGSSTEGNFDPRYATAPSQQVVWDNLLSESWPTTWANDGAVVCLINSLQPYQYGYNAWWQARQTKLRIGIHIDGAGPSIQTIACTVGCHERNRPIETTNYWGNVPLPYTGWPYGDANCYYPADQDPLVVNGGQPGMPYTADVELNSERSSMVNCVAERNPVYDQTYPGEAYGEVYNVANYYVTWEPLSQETQPFADMACPYTTVCPEISIRSLRLRYTDSNYRVGKALMEAANFVYG